MKPKVLIGCPTSDHKAYCLDAFAEGLKQLTYPNFDVLLVDNSATEDYAKRIETLGIPVERVPYTDKARNRIIRARNVLREKALNEGYDYFFSLEQDVIPPPNVIEQLLARNKKIVTGIYYKEYSGRNNPENKLIRPLAYKKIDDTKIQQFTAEEVDHDQLIEIGACGVGIIFIHRDVLKKVTFRYDPAKEGFDDVWFCKDAREAGFTLYADCAVKCKHLVHGMDWNQIEK